MKILAGMTTQITSAERYQAPGSEKIKKALNTAIARAMGEMSKFISNKWGGGKYLFTDVSARESYRGSSEIILWSDPAEDHRAFLKIAIDLFDNTISGYAWICEDIDGPRRFETRVKSLRILYRPDIKFILEDILFDKKKWQGGKPAFNLKEEIDSISKWVSAGTKRG